MIINKVNITSSKYCNFSINSSYSISFREKQLGEEVLYSKSEEIDLQIKKILDDAIINQCPLIYDNIAKKMNMSTDMIRTRILTNPELKDLWHDVIHKKPIKRRTKAIIHPNNNVNDNELVLKIKSFLENAIKTDTPITSTDILPELGVSRDVFKGRIKGNPELNDLWNKCKHRTQTIVSIDSQKVLKKVLLESLNNGMYITYHELSKRTNLSEEALKNRIMRNEELFDLWTQIKQQQKEQKNDSIKKIQNVLLTLIEKGSVLEIDKIARMTGLEVKACKHKIDENPELLKLWQSGLHKRTSLPTSEESKLINSKIKEVLEQANKDGILMRNEDIAQKAGINVQICYGRLKRFPELYSLWKENNKLSLIEFEKTNQKIREVISCAIKQKQALSFAELSTLTGLSKSLCSNRIYADKELKSLWDKVQIIAKEATIEKIQNAILKAMECNDKITYRLMEKEYGITPDILKARLKDNSKLKELWEQAEHNVRNLQNNKEKTDLNKFEQSIINDEKIAEELQKAINEGRAVFQKEIADKIGMTQGACKERIKRVPKLNELWQKVEHKSIQDSSAELNDKIRTILQKALDEKEDLSIEEVAKKAGITKLTCMGRFRINEDLNVLWNQLKDNRDLLVKQIAKLKLEKKSDSQIKQELGLNEKVSEELFKKYENIQRMILSHYDKNISDTEYLKWAVITKREFELAITKLLENMGYKTGATRYVIDGGVDVIAQKDGKKTYIECVHNLEKPINANEVLALQGCKYYFGADDLILVSSSGLLRGAKSVLSAINKNNGGKYRVMVLEDIIKLAKKYNLNVDDLSNVKEINHKQEPQQRERKEWLFKQLESVSEEERNDWKNLSEKDFINRVKKIFEKQEYKISKIAYDIMKNAYLLEKNGERAVLQYVSPSVRQADAVRCLYGSKDVFNAKKVILFGWDSLSYASQDYISMVNKKFGSECAFKILSLDKIIMASKKLL